MNIPSAFKYNSDVKYRIGGVFEPTHQFSLINQIITIKRNSNFKVSFLSFWESYKLPQIKDKKVYENWISNPIQFYQNQLNFAIWAATTGCGISKLDHLRHKNPIIRSIFRFHVYYQIRKILNEMQCPLPSDSSFNALDNGIDKNAFQRICSEFGISPQSDFRQKLDHSHGFGSVRYYSSHGLKSKPTKVLERGRDYDPSQHWTVFIPASGKFGAHDQHRYKIEYIEQYFSKDNVGSQYDAIGSFVLDKSDGFTQAGVARINDSIRTYVWAILGAQAQTRTSILGKGKAFDAQKQFISNVYDAINSAVDIPGSIDRYQSTLQYAQSQVNYVIGQDLYMIPENLDLYIGTINGYNNLIVIASPDKMESIQLGHNNVNNKPAISQETFESPPDDFDFEHVDDQPESPFPLDEQSETLTSAETPSESVFGDDTQKNTQLTHDETKLLITTSGIIGGSFLLWYLKS